jgi:hypothetical protein
MAGPLKLPSTSTLLQATERSVCERGGTLLFTAACHVRWSVNYW